MDNDELTYQEWETLGMVVGWQIEGIKRLRGMPVQDIIAVSSFMGIEAPEDAEEKEQEVREKFDTILLELRSVRRKIKDISGV